MTDMTLPASRFAEREFRVGDAMNKAIQILSRNLLPFSIVTGIAALPNVLIFQANPSTDPTVAGAMYVGGALVWIVLLGLSQAVMLNAAFEDMRGRPVDMMASFRASWRRFLAVIGVVVVSYALMWLAAVALIFPGFMVATMLYVATPVCVVERLGPFKSLGRSAVLTKGSRWGLFGMIIAVWFIGAIGSGMVQAVAYGVGPAIAPVIKVIWEALLGAYGAILGVVTYHDLRVAKEGVDTDQIAAVFE